MILVELIEMLFIMYTQLFFGEFSYSYIGLATADSTRYSTPERYLTWYRIVSSIHLVSLV